MPSLDQALGIHPQALMLRARRAELLAVNLANSDTPNYQARDIDFRTVLSNHGDSTRLTATHTGHIGGGAEGLMGAELVQKFSDQARATVKERIAARPPAPVDVEPAPEKATASVRPELVGAEALESNDGASLWSDSSTVKLMQRELSGLRGLLEQQMCGLAWSEFGGKHPTQARLLRVLARAGIAPTLGRTLIAALPEKVRFEDGWRLTLGALESRLEVLDDPILKFGGRVILCGPSGVGKTLLACKLAAQYAIKHGPDSVALVSTDDQRLGAQQQLKVFGSLLGISVHSTRKFEELTACLDRLADKQLIIIDTAGVPVDDIGLREMVTQLALLEQPVESYLVLAASTDYLTLNKILDATAGLSFQGCVLTKIDEAAVLGPAISAVVEAGLPVAYLCAGQQVPDDLEAPIARHLVSRAIALAGETPSPENPAALERAFVTETY